MTSFSSGLLNSEVVFPKRYYLRVFRVHVAVRNLACGWLLNTAFGHKSMTCLSEIKWQIVCGEWQEANSSPGTHSTGILLEIRNPFSHLCLLWDLSPSGSCALIHENDVGFQLVSRLAGLNAWIVFIDELISVVIPISDCFLLKYLNLECHNCFPFLDGHSSIFSL